jgi:AcrR family transcriptional regulator
VARGTFYNHFTSIDDLAEAARDALVDELVQLSLEAVAAIEDPAEACAKSLRLAMGLTATYPLLARFSVQLSINMVQHRNLLTQLLPPLLIKGMEMGRFCRMPPDLAVDNISALAIVALQRQAASIPFAVPEVIAGVLRMLGLSDAEARVLADLPAPLVVADPQGLIVQSDAAMRGQA